MAYVANLTIDHTEVAANATDFPVYVDLSDMNADFWSTVANGGGDIRIFKSDGTTELAREVVSCDTSGETGELHFKYTGTLSSSVDTEIQIHADGSSSDYAVGATYGRNNVWSDYFAVFHGSATNSVGSTNNGTLSGTTTTTGKIGDAISFDASANNYLQVQTSGAVDWLNGFGTTDKTIQSWLKPSSVTVTNGYTPLLYNNDSDNAPRVRVFLYEDDMNFEVRDNANNLALAEWSAGGTTSWQMVHSTWDVSSDTTTIFVDATQRGTGSGSIGTINQFSSAEYLTFGATNIGGAINSLTDINDLELNEIRLINSVLSADWITTEYNNQNSPSTFYTISDAGETFTISESLSLSETSTNLRGLVSTTNESLSVSETISALKGISFTIAESLGLVESYAFLRTRLFTIAESLNVVEIKATVQKKWSNISKSTVATVTNGVKTAVSVITNTPKS